MVRLSLKLLATAVGACFAFSVRAFVPGPTLAPLVEAVSPAVVCIRTQNADGGMRDGAGFIVSEDGLILSNDHVVKDAEQINMTLADGTVLKGYVVGRDGKTDVALLKAVTETPLPAVDFATSAGVRTGDWVLALGNPYGLGDGLCKAPRKMTFCKPTPWCIEATPAVRCLTWTGASSACPPRF